MDAGVVEIKVPEIVDCPFCFGSGTGVTGGRAKCRSCDGSGRVEKHDTLGIMRAQPGTILPTPAYGKTRHRICLFGEPKATLRK